MQVRKDDTPRTLLLRTAMALARPSPGGGEGPPDTPMHLKARRGAELLAPSSGSKGAYVSPMLSVGNAAAAAKARRDATPRDLFRRVATTATPGAPESAGKRRALEEAIARERAGKRMKDLAGNGVARQGDDGGWDEVMVAGQEEEEGGGGGEESGGRVARPVSLSALPERLRPRASVRPEGMPYTPPRPLSPVDVSKGEGAPQFMQAENVARNILSQIQSAPPVPARKTKAGVVGGGGIGESHSIDSLVADVRAAKRAARRAKTPGGVLLPALPRSTIKVMFEQFLGTTVSQDVIDVVLDKSYEFFGDLSREIKNSSLDLGNPQNSIEVRESRIRNLFVRQGFIASEDQMNDIIREYLPRELTELLIPVARPTLVDFGGPSLPVPLGGGAGGGGDDDDDEYEYESDSDDAA